MGRFVIVCTAVVLGVFVVACDKLPKLNADGEALLAAGKAQTAEQRFRDALVANPKRVIARLNLGRALQAA